jgi:8-oxo-dGTP pyrophosphatase MutT (NUDIX family)
VRIQLGRAGGKLATRLTDIAAGRIAVPELRDAATVIILRPAQDGTQAGRHGGGDPGVEVLMLRRTAAMAFAPGAYVFPGGSVDPGDYADIGWYGPSAAEFGARLGASAELARALVIAAVRETFEESGLLLAGASGGPVADPSGPSWEADRAALISGALTLPGLFAARGLVLRADLLVPWARWITPDAEVRRFDARFFAAALPAGQLAAGHAAESDHVAWLRPAAAIDAARRREIVLFPPTAVLLNELASAAAAGTSLPGILAQRRTIEPVRPRMEVEDGTPWLILPDTVAYPLSEASR